MNIIQVPNILSVQHFILIYLYTHYFIHLFPQALGVEPKDKHISEIYSTTDPYSYSSHYFETRLHYVTLTFLDLLCVPDITQTCTSLSSPPEKPGLYDDVSIPAYSLVLPSPIF